MSGELQISAEEFIGKFQEMFPQEATIALQALQISKLQDALPEVGEDDGAE